MPPTHTFDIALVLAALAGTATLLASRLGEKIRIPPAALILVASAAVVALAGAGHPAETGVNDVVSVALIAVLFDGGMQIGRASMRPVLTTVAAVGLAGTFATAVAVAAVLHFAFAIDWYPALLIGTAVAPTDPAVVFSVLGTRPAPEPAATIVKAESGANDPVGIAMMTALLGAGKLSGGAVAHAVVVFFLAMAVGLVVGVAGGVLLRWTDRPGLGPAQHPLRSLVASVLIYGGASLAHGSGFLAVFVMGITLGDSFDDAARRFHESLAGLAELVVFAILGATIEPGVLDRLSVWGPGVAVAAVLTIAIRPLVVGALTGRSHLKRSDRAFVAFAGLKGAVPLLLGSYLLTTTIPGRHRLFGIVAVVVLVSVVVQGGLAGPVGRVLSAPASSDGARLSAGGPLRWRRPGGSASSG